MCFLASYLITVKRINICTLPRRITRSPPGPLREVPFAWFLPADQQESFATRLGVLKSWGILKSPWLLLSHGYPRLNNLGCRCQETSISLLVGFLHGNESHFIPIQSTSMCSRHPNPKSTQPDSPSLILSPTGWMRLWHAMANHSKTMKSGAQKKQSSSRYNPFILKLTIPKIGWQQTK